MCSITGMFIPLMKPHRELSDPDCSSLCGSQVLVDMASPSVILDGISPVCFHPLIISPQTQIPFPTCLFFWLYRPWCGICLTTYLQVWGSLWTYTWNSFGGLSVWGTFLEKWFPNIFLVISLLEGFLKYAKGMLALWYNAVGPWPMTLAFHMEKPVGVLVGTLAAPRLIQLLAKCLRSSRKWP